MIESIKIKIREDLVIELTLEEAKNLQNDLNKLSWKYNWKYKHKHFQFPQIPIYQPFRYEITCSDGTK